MYSFQKQLLKSCAKQERGSFAKKDNHKMKKLKTVMEGCVATQQCKKAQRTKLIKNKNHKSISQTTQSYKHATSQIYKNNNNLAIARNKTRMLGEKEKAKTKHFKLGEKRYSCDGEKKDSKKYVYIYIFPH